LGSANRNRAEDLRGTLENETTLGFREERLYPSNQVGRDPPFGEEAGNLVCADMVETPFN